MATIHTEYRPDGWTARGRRGDAIPATPVEFPFTRADIATMDATNWTATAQLRATPDSVDVLHEFTVTLTDSGDDAELAVDVLLVTVAPMSGAESAALDAGVYLGDIQLARTGEDPLTVVTIRVTIVDDYARPV